MRNLWTIIKKELRRFFTDKRMLISLLLPGIMIFVLYTIMGDVMGKILIPGEDEVYKVVAINEPEAFKEAIGAQFNIEYVEFNDEEAQAAVKDKELELYVVFPEDFLTNYQNGVAQEVTFYYNSTSSKSSTLFSTYNGVLIQLLQTSQALKITPADQATAKDNSIMLVTSLVPFLLITFLFSGVMAVAPESIAGEKERGTIANLLITPVKRSHIALGKIIALSLTALTSAASSFIGLMLSVPKLMGSNLDVDLSIYYRADTLMMLLLIIMTTVLVFTVLISLISTYAKSIKEANGLATPMMILVMLVGVTTLMGTAVSNHFLYLIPVYNSVNALLSIFSLKVDMLNLVLTIVSNIAVTGLGVFILTRMFNSEKVMFRK